MILLDSNVPMYLVGAEHPHKVDARRLLERAVAEQRRIVTDAFHRVQRFSTDWHANSFAGATVRKITRACGVSAWLR